MSAVSGSKAAFGATISGAATAATGACKGKKVRAFFKPSLDTMPMYNRIKTIENLIKPFIDDLSENLRWLEANAKSLGFDSVLKLSALLAGEKFVQDCFDKFSKARHAYLERPTTIDSQEEVCKSAEAITSIFATIYTCITEIHFHGVFSEYALGINDSIEKFVIKNLLLETLSEEQLVNLQKLMCDCVDQPHNWEALIKANPLKLNSTQYNFIKTFAESIQVQNDKLRLTIKTSFHSVKVEILENIFNRCVSMYIDKILNKNLKDVDRTWFLYLSTVIVYWKAHGDRVDVQNSSYLEVLSQIKAKSKKAEGLFIWMLKPLKEMQTLRKSSATATAAAAVDSASAATATAAAGTSNS
jgi:hypothetical protein